MTSGDQRGAREPASPTTVTLSRGLALARRRWLIIASIGLVAAAAAAAVSFTRPAVYEAQAEVLLSNRNLSAEVAGVNVPSQDPERLIATQTQIARLPVIEQRALAAVGLPKDYDIDMSVSGGNETDILRFTVKDGDPERANALVDELSKQFVAYRSDLDTAELKKAQADVQREIDRLAASGSGSEALVADLRGKAQQLQTLETVGGQQTIVVDSGEPAEKVGPQPIRDGFIALVFGILAGIASAVMIEVVDRSVRDEEDAREILGVPILARLPKEPKRRNALEPLAAISRPNGPTAEAFRMLRANLNFARAVQDARVILVTSAIEGEGKTTTAGNLAVTLTGAHQSVVLMDLDLRRPRLSALLGVDRRPGLTDLVAGLASPSETQRWIPVESQENALPGDQNELRFIPSGTTAPNPGELVTSPRVTEAIRNLKAAHDVVLLDTPPVLQCGDALSLAPAADGILLVVRLGRVERNHLHELRRAMDASTIPVLGLVIVGGSKGKGYGYGYEAAGDSPGAPESLKAPSGEGAAR